MVEDQGAKEGRYNPAATIGGLLLGAFVDAIVEILAVAGAGLEAACLSHFDEEAGPEHDDQYVEYHDSKTELPLQDSFVNHVGHYAEEHSG